MTSGEQSSSGSSLLSIDSNNQTPSDDTHLLIRPNPHDPPTNEHHCHFPKREDNTSATAKRQLIAVSILCLLFMIGEIIGGTISNSLALLTDATHLASDLASFLISLFAIYIAQKPQTSSMSWGFHRAEVLGALGSVLLIWIVTGILCFLAVHRVIHQEFEIKADEMLVVAGMGVAFNITMGTVLHFEWCACRPAVRSFSHGHSHGGGGSHSRSRSRDNLPSSSYQNHSHSPVANSGELYSSINYAPLSSDEESMEIAPLPSDADKPSIARNINVRAAFIHVLGDLLQSIGVLIAAYLIKFKPEYKLADPICTFVFSVLVLFTTITVLRDVLGVLMEAVPRGINFKMVKQDLEGIEGVRAAHSLHIWALTIDKPALAAHLAIDEGVDNQRVLNEARRLLTTKYNIHRTTVQVEQYQQTIMSACDECVGSGD